MLSPRDIYPMRTYRDHGTGRHARLRMSNLVDDCWAWEWGTWKRCVSHFMSNGDGAE